MIGRKLKNWRASMRSGPGGTTCRTKASTGDPEIDAIGCAAMTACWPAALVRYEASIAKGVARADRRRLQDEANKTLTACAQARHRRDVEALALRRTGGS